MAYDSEEKFNSKRDEAIRLIKKARVLLLEIQMHPVFEDRNGVYQSHIAKDTAQLLVIAEHI